MIKVWIRLKLILAMPEQETTSWKKWCCNWRKQPAGRSFDSRHWIVALLRSLQISRTWRWSRILFLQNVTMSRPLRDLEDLAGKADFHQPHLPSNEQTSGLEKWFWGEMKRCQPYKNGCLWLHRTGPLEGLFIRQLCLVRQPLSFSSSTIWRECNSSPNTLEKNKGEKNLLIWQRSQPMKNKVWKRLDK